MTRLPILTIAVFSLLASPVQAEEGDGDYGRPGLYVAGYGLVGFSGGRRCRANPGAVSGRECQGLGVAKYPLGHPGEYKYKWQIDGGANLRLGWRENSWLAYELEVEWINLGRERDALLTWGPNAKFYMLVQAVQPFFLVGFGGMTVWPKAAERDTVLGFRVGAGVDWYLTENIALSTEYTFVWGTSNLWESYYLTAGVGVLYRF